MMIRFTYCKNFASAETKETEWEPFAKALTTFKAFPSKEASVKRAAFVGGLRADEDKGRADGNIVLRTVATLDFDAPQGTLDEIEFTLQLMLPCAFVAYSTFRHTPEVPRFRLCIPLSSPVNEAEHNVVVREIVDTVGLGSVDNCSFTMSQLMFLPSHRDGITPWSLRQDGEPWKVRRTEISISVRNGAGGSDGDALGDDDGSALELMTASEPLDMGVAEVDAILENYPAEGKEYDEWLRVGMALYHQFRGSEDGWDRWATWSALSSKHNPRQMRTKWRSFGGDRNPVTMASIIHFSGGRRAAIEIKPTGQTFVGLEAEAQEVKTLDQYTEFRNKIRAMNEVRLGVDMRAMLASVVHEVYGEAAGLTKSEVKKAFRPLGKGVRGSGQAGQGGTNDENVPDWLKDWTYCQADATFERISVRHSIKREAFRMMFDRMPEVVGAETDAPTYATKYCNLQTVASLMYWPGADRMFETADGLLRLNTYTESGIEPCKGLEGDEDGQRVVDLFMAHVRNTVSSEREQRILIDFMAFVYQNPGKRVRWALLLRGIEGNGKSYFYSVMQSILGMRARVVSTTAIDSAFTGWAEGAILVGIEEIRISGTNKYAILDKMKPIITNDTIAVVHKGRDEKHVPNFTSYMMMTNHADAIPVGDNDRRYCVIATRHTRQQDLFDQHGGREGAAEYFRLLFDESARRADALARFLLGWELSADFNPAGRAPETEGLLEMRAMHVSEERDDVESAIEAHTCPIIGPDILDVTYLNSMVVMEGKELPRTKALGHILSDMGYAPIDGRRVKITKTRVNHFVWWRRGAKGAAGELLSPNDVKELVRNFHSGETDFSDAPF